MHGNQAISRCRAGNCDRSMWLDHIGSNPAADRWPNSRLLINGGCIGTDSLLACQDRSDPSGTRPIRHIPLSDVHLPVVRKQDPRDMVLSGSPASVRVRVMIGSPSVFHPPRNDMIAVNGICIGSDCGCVLSTRTRRRVVSRRSDDTELTLIRSVVWIKDSPLFRYGLPNLTPILLYSSLSGVICFLGG